VVAVAVLTAQVLQRAVLVEAVLVEDVIVLKLLQLQGLLILEEAAVAVLSIVLVRLADQVV
jgi:hypothetical protein